MRKIAIFILLLGIFYRVFSQNNDINISVVDSFGKPLITATIYLDNDSAVMTENQLHSFIERNANRLNANKIEYTRTDIDGKANLKNLNFTYVHAFMFGYHSTTIKIDSTKLNYCITLFEKTYDFPKLTKTKKSFNVERNNLGDEFVNTLIIYNYKPNTFDTIDGVIYRIETPHVPENIEDSIILSLVSPHAYPVNGEDRFFENLSKQIDKIRFKEIVIDFTILKSDSIIVTKVEGVSKKKCLWIKEMFCKLDSWKAASTGRKVSIKYRLKIINDRKII